MKLLYKTPEIEIEWEVLNDIVTLSDGVGNVDPDFELED